MPHNQVDYIIGRRSLSVLEAAPFSMLEAWEVLQPVPFEKELYARWDHQRLPSQGKQSARTDPCM
jgi:hypothetical protein